jgi:hypothetical protein
MKRNVALIGLLSYSLGAAAMFGFLAPGATHATSEVTGPAPHDGGWLVTSFAEFQSPRPPADDGGELDEVQALVARRSAADVERIRWWDVGGPAYRWNQLAVGEMLGAFVTTLPATRNLTRARASPAGPGGHLRRQG